MEYKQCDFGCRNLWLMHGCCKWLALCSRYLKIHINCILAAILSAPHPKGNTPMKQSIFRVTWLGSFTLFCQAMWPKYIFCQIWAWHASMFYERLAWFSAGKAFIMPIIIQHYFLDGEGSRLCQRTSACCCYSSPLGQDWILSSTSSVKRQCHIPPCAKLLGLIMQVAMMQTIVFWI